MAERTHRQTVEAEGIHQERVEGTNSLQVAEGVAGKALRMAVDLSWQPFHGIRPGGLTLPDYQT